jgi:Uma2 family endonuclease
MQQATATQQAITPEEYLEGEKVAEVRHEYIDGELFAMAGASDAHAKISLNAASLLKAHLRGSPCSAYIADMKAQADETKYFYPDVMVTCDEGDRKSNYAKRNPTLIIEVLSSNTEGYDRGKKFEFYRRMASLREYVLIDQSEYHVDIFRKDANQRWVLFSQNQPDGEVCFCSLDFRCALIDLYEEVDFELAQAGA